MAEKSTYHLGSVYNRNTTVGVRFNFFRPNLSPCQVRYFNLIINGTTDLCEAETAAGCPVVTEPNGECSSLAAIMCNDSMPNEGSWASLADSMLTRLNDRALAMVKDTSVDSTCRRVKSFDLLQTAFLLNDTTSVKLGEVRHTFATIFSDSTEPRTLRSATLLLKASLHERLGEYDSAAALYGQHATDFTDQQDREYASWRAEALDAYLTDTTRGIVYDSLMLVLDTRIFDEKFGAYPPSLVKRGHEPAAQTGALPYTLNAQPNPFSKATQLTWTQPESAAVKIVVTDIFGRTVAVIFEGLSRAGTHTAQFDGSLVPEGVYFSRLETEGTILTKQIVLMK